jgi:hypothetical protein
MGSIKSNDKLGIYGAKHLDPPTTNYWGGTVVEERGLNYTEIDEGSYREVVVRVRDKNTAMRNRTIVTGKVVDLSGDPIPKALVVSIRGTVHECDKDGEYRFFHYSIIETSAGDPSLDTYLIPVRTGTSCSPFYDENQIYNYNFNYPSWFPGGGTPPPNSVTNSVPLELSIPSFIGDVSSMIVISSFKRGFDGKFGIVYYDRGLRSGTVNYEENLKVHIPFYTERYQDAPAVKGVPYINWQVKHRPPKWATHWQWLRTRNETVGSYFQWAVDGVRYTDSDGTLSSYNNGTRVRVSIETLTTYGDRNPGADLGIQIDPDSWRIRFIKDSAGNPFPYVDQKILEYDQATKEIVFEKDFTLRELFAGTLIEAYNSKLDIEEDIFFEFGECFEVGEDSQGNKYHKGHIQNQDPINPGTTPATGRFRFGDTYYRLRSFGFNSVNNPGFIDDDSVSDFYPSEVESIGRANGINNDFFQKWRPNQIRHGGRYVPDSNVNDLSRFLSSDFQPLPIGYGDINKLILASNVLLSIHEFRWVSNYIEEGIVRKQGGTNEIIASTQVFDSFRAAKPITGTINPESVQEWRGKVFAIDINKGIVNKYDANGITAISEFKMKDFFSDISKVSLETVKGNTGQKIIGFIDPKREEYILSFREYYTPEEVNDQLGAEKVVVEVNKSITIEDTVDNTLYSVVSKENQNNIVFDTRNSTESKDLQVDNQLDSNGELTVKVIDSEGVISNLTTLQPGQGIDGLDLNSLAYNVKQTTEDASRVGGNEPPVLEAVTIAYSDRFNKWTTFYSFTPEMFGRIDLEMLGFTEGKLWIHNDSETRNNFYGEQYTSILETIFNDLPSQVKVFEAAGADSYHAWSIPSAKTPNGMETEVVAQRFVRREDSFYAPMMRDKNDPTFTNENEAIINGRKLRDRTILVTFENTETDEVVLFSVSMNSTISTRHAR